MVIICRCVVPVKDLEGNVKELDDGDVAEFSIPAELKQVKWIDRREGEKKIIDGEKRTVFY